LLLFVHKKKAYFPTMLPHEPAIRLTVFLSMLALMAVLEAIHPARRREIPRLLRWSNNLALVAVDTVLVRLLFPLAAVGVAVWAQQRGWGLLHGMPGWLAWPAALLLLDLAIYAQHIVLHTVPPLWRLHRLHHADTEFDVTTGVRFHPGEIVLSMGFKLLLVLALGPPPEAVLVFEVVLNASSMFNHANLRLPGWLDRWLRWVVVTPDMHRVHHSVVPAETNSNFGFNLPWWDRLFGTYRAQPRAGQCRMTIGLDAFRDRREAWLWRMLTQPWRR